MKLMAEDLDFLLDAAGIKPDTRQSQVMHLRHVDGYTDQAIAAELGVKVGTVRGYASEAWQKIRERRELGPFIQVLEIITEELERREDDPAYETLREHAEGLLRALRGHRRGAPVVQDFERDGAVTKNLVLDVVREHPLAVARAQEREWVEAELRAQARIGERFLRERQEREAETGKTAC